MSRENLENNAELKIVCQRPDCIQRYVSIYITRFILKFNLMSPTQVTVLDFFIGLIGVALFFLESDWAFLIGALMMQLFEIFDCVDGEVARYLIYKGELNRSEDEKAEVEFIQDIVHIILQPLMFLGFSFGLYLHFSYLFILLLGFIAASGSAIDTYINILREKLLGSVGLKDCSRVYKEIRGTGEKLLYKIPFGRYILDFMTFVTPIPGVLVVILIASILDLGLLGPGGNFVLFNYDLNFKILILAAYALIEQALWILNAAGSIKSFKSLK